MTQSFYMASNAAKQYAQANELTAESIGEFKAKQEAAITAIEKGSLASKAASLATGLLTGALASLGTALLSLGIQWVLDMSVLQKQQTLCVVNMNLYKTN